MRCFYLTGLNWKIIYYWTIGLSLLYCRSSCLGQGLESASGAKAMSMGGASVTIYDEYAWGNNPAGAAEVKHVSIASSFRNRFSLSSMNSIALFGTLPIKKMTIGGSITKYGDAYYSEQKLGLGAASKISNVALGSQIHVLQIRMDELPTRWAWIGEFGGIAQLSKSISWGAHIWNFNLAQIKTRQKTELPAVLRTGLHYQPISKITISAQLEKHISHSPSILLGLEYLVVEWMSIRTGFATKPFNGCIGTGLKFGKFKLDYAFSTHTWIGNSHQLSLAMAIPKKHLAVP